MAYSAGSSDSDSLHKWFEESDGSDTSVREMKSKAPEIPDEGLTVVIPSLEMDPSAGDSQSGDRSFFESSDAEFRDEDAVKFAQTYSGQNLEILGGNESEEEIDPMAKSCSFFPFPDKESERKKRGRGPIKPSKFAHRLCPQRNPALPNFSFLKKNEGYTAVDLFTQEDFDVDVDRCSKSYAGQSFFDQSFNFNWASRSSGKTDDKRKLLDLTKSHPEASIRRSKIRSKLNLASMVNRLYPKELNAIHRPKFAFLRRGLGTEQNPPLLWSESEDGGLKGRNFRLSSVDSVEVPSFGNQEYARPYAVTFDPLSSSAATAYGSSVSSYRSPLLPRRQKLRRKQRSEEKEDTTNLNVSDLKNEEKLSSGNSSDRPESVGKRKKIRERAELRLKRVTKTSSASSDENWHQKLRKKSSTSSAEESSGGSPYRNGLLPPISPAESFAPRMEHRLSLSYSMDMLKDANLLSKSVDSPVLSGEYRSHFFSH